MAASHRRGGVAHHVVVVRWRAVTLQAVVQRRVVQTEVQRGNCRRELLLLHVVQDGLLTLAHGLHPGNALNKQINKNIS